MTDVTRHIEILALAKKMRQLEFPNAEGWKSWEQSRLKDKYMHWAELALKAMKPCKR